MISINYKDSFNKVSKEEVAHIVKEFIALKKCDNLAYFFISQPYVTIDDIFIYEDFIDVDVYKEIFKHIAYFYIDCIEKSSEIPGDVNSYTISRFEFSQYNKDEALISSKRDKVMSGWIDAMLIHFIEHHSYDSIDLLLGAIFDNTSIPSQDIINSILTDDRFDFVSRIIVTCFARGYVQIDYLVKNASVFMNRLTESDFNSILYEFNDDENKMCHMLWCLYAEYFVYESNTGTIVSEYVGDKNNRKAIEYIKTLLFNTISVDVEQDFYYEYLDAGLKHHSSSGDMMYVSIYKDMKNWYIENIESGVFNENFINNNYVDIGNNHLPLSHDGNIMLSGDIHQQLYLLRFAEMGSGYDAFIRLINISRFKFLETRRRTGITNMISNSHFVMTHLGLISMAVDSKFIGWLLYI